MTDVNTPEELFFRYKGDIAKELSKGFTNDQVELWITHSCNTLCKGQSMGFTVKFAKLLRHAITEVETAQSNQKTKTISQDPGDKLLSEIETLELKVQSLTLKFEELRLSRALLGAKLDACSECDAQLQDVGHNLRCAKLGNIDLKVLAELRSKYQKLCMDFNQARADICNALV